MADTLNSTDGSFYRLEGMFPDDAVAAADAENAGTDARQTTIIPATIPTLTLTLLIAKIRCH